MGTPKLLEDPKKVYNVATTVDPTATDDVGKTIAVGCRWVNTSTGAVFVCQDNSFMAAVWIALEGLTGGKVPMSNLPAGTASGLATLNGASKVVQEPASKGLASGMAGLDGTAKLALANQNVADKTVTPPLITRGFTGKNGAGAITVAGLPLAAKVITIFSIGGTTANAMAAFEATISVAGQIQQSAVGDLSTEKFVVMVLS